MQTIRKRQFYVNCVMADIAVSEKCKSAEVASLEASSKMLMWKP